MSQITPQMVKELREKTGAGMADCKSALTDSNGVMADAIEILRKKGAATAAKRADRVSNEGIVAVRKSSDNKTAIMVKVNSETDFVSRNAEFENFANTVADAYLVNEANNVEELMAVKVGNDTILGLYNEILAKFSERIEISKSVKIKTNGYIGSYTHSNKKLGVLVEISSDKVNDKIQTLVHDITMQVAAMNPQYVNRTQVTQEVIDKEIEIYKELAVQEGKKPEIAERVATGRLEKFFGEVCLLEQSFVKDASKTIKDVVKEISAEAGEEVTIVSFERFLLGEA